MKSMFEKYQDPRETLLYKLYAGTERESAYGPISMDRENQTISLENNSLELTPYEYQILWILVRAQGGIVTETEIESFLQEDKFKKKDDIPLSNVVKTHISRLRRKLEAAGMGRIQISNLTERGYFLEIKPDEEGA